MGADTSLTPGHRLRTCWRSRCWGPSRSDATAGPCRCRAARRRSCWCASRSRPGVFVRADRLLDELWAGASTNRNTLQSKVAGCAGRSATRRRSPAARAATGSRSSRARSTRSRLLRDAATAAERLDAGDARGAAELQRWSRYRGRAAAGGRRLGRARTGPGSRRRACSSSRPGSRRARGSGERRDRRAGGGRGGAPVPGGPVGAAGHRALPGGAPGRRAGGLPARPGAAGRRARPRSRAAAAAARAADPQATTRRSADCRGRNLPSLSAELVGREAEIAALAELLRGPAAGRDRRAGRDREDGGRDRHRADAARRRSGWRGWRARRPPTTSSTR